MDIPRQPSGDSPEARFDQRTHEELYSGRRRIVANSGVGISETSRGRILKIPRRPFGTSGWRWASPKKYDSTRLYSVNEITIVGPNNDAVAEGATPGEWICLREPVIDPDTEFVHLPIWPPPGISEEDALDFPDDINIYWWPQQLYCV